MKFKKIMLITFVLLAILTIGAVSASDDLTTDDVAAGDDAGVIADSDDGDDDGDDGDDGDDDGDDGDDGDDDGDDGDLDADCYIDEDSEWNVNDEDDLKNPFAEVTLAEHYDGNITIVCDDDSVVFDKNLMDIESAPDDEGDGNVYYIFLGEITDLYKFLASESFTLTFTHVDGRSASWTYDIEYDSDIGVVGFVENDSWDDEESYTFAEEFDIADENAWVFSLNCYDFEGIFYIKYWGPDEEDSRDPIIYAIGPDDEDKILNFTAKDFGIDKTGRWAFDVFLLEDENEKPTYDWEDPDGNGNCLYFIDCEAIDYTQFRVLKIWWARNLVSVYPLVSVYCPDGKEATINLVFKKIEDGAGNITFSKTTADKDENNFVTWNLTELGINEVCEISILSVNVDGDELLKFDEGDTELYVRIHSPTEISEYSYLDSDDEDRMIIARISLESDITEAEIILNINGKVIPLTLENFTQRDDGTSPEDLYWEHPGDEDGVDKEMKVYFITNKNIDYDFTLENSYDVTVTLNAVGMTVTDNEKVTFVRPNSVTEGNVTITIYDAEEYYLGEDEFEIIRVDAPEDANGTICVKLVDGDDWLIEANIQDYENMLFPNELDLYAGEYDIFVSYVDEEGNEVLNTTAKIRLCYGEDGIMHTEVDEKILYYNEWEAIHLSFDKKTISGEIVIKINGEEYYRNHIDTYNFDPDEYEKLRKDDDGKIIFTISPSMFNKTIEVGYYDLLEIYYTDDNGYEENATYEDIEIVIDDIEMFICNTDDDGKYADYEMNRGDMIHIYPYGRDISSARIIVLVDSEEYLNATIKDLDLILEVNDEGNEYYTVGPAHFTTPVTFGHYDDVVAYLDVDDDGEFDCHTEGIDFFNIIGMVDEIEYNDTESVVISIFCHDKDGNIILSVRNHDDWDNPFDIPIDISKNEFIYLTLNDLNLPMGHYTIEAFYGEDDERIFDKDLRIVNNSDFRAKSESDWIFETGEVFFVYSPQGSEGTITLSGNKINTVTKDIVPGAYVGFTFSELGITQPDEYEINILASGKEFNETIWVNSPIEFNPNCVACIADENDDNAQLTKVVSLKLPFDATEPIIISIDGVNQTVELKDIQKENWGDCFYYTVSTADITAEEGEHRVIVSYGGISDVRTISFNKRNINSTDGVTLELISAAVKLPDVWDDNYLAVITTSDEYFKLVMSFDNGDEQIFEPWDLRNDDLGKGKFIYYLQAKDIDEIRNGALPLGFYNFTVVYMDNDDNEVIRNNDILRLIQDLDIVICYTDDNNNAEYYWGDDGRTIIDIWCSVLDGFESLRVVLLIDGTRYIDDIISNLSYDTSIDEFNHRHININFNNTNIPVGHHNNVVAYCYGEGYSACTDDSDFSAREIDVYWGVVNVDIEQNRPVRIDEDQDLIWIYCPDEAQGRLIVEIEGEVYFNKTLADMGGRNIGPANFSKSIKPRLYEVYVSYIGEDGFTANANGQVNLTGIPPEIFIMTENGQANFSNLSDDMIHIYPNSDESDFRVVVTIDGEEYLNATIAELGLTPKYNDKNELYYTVGPANFNKVLAPANYNNVVATCYSEDYGKMASNDNGGIDHITINNDPVNPNFVISIEDVEEGNPVVVNVTAIVSFTGDVIVKINGSDVAVHIERGVGSNTTSLAVGKYLATIDFAATSEFKEAHAEKEFAVLLKPVDPKLTIGDVASVEVGSPVIIIIKADENFTGEVKVLIGENVVATSILTNGIGNATIPADKLAVGSITVHVTSEAFDKFLAGYANTTFSVTAKKSGGDGKTDSGTGTTKPAKKAATKIIAKKKTFKAKKKVKKYTITLKSGKKAVKKAKVTLKVGKKTYKAKTNKKGKATFKITKLNKKGKYKAVIKFAGTKLYKPTKRTVKITVKK